MKNILLSAVLCFVLLVPSVGLADFVSYTDRGSFELDAGPTTNEGFETGPQGESLVAPLLFTSGLELESASGGVTINVTPENATFGFLNTTPGGLFVLNFTGSSSELTYELLFELPVYSTAFGFDLGGFQPNFLGNGTLPVEFFQDGSSVGSVVVKDNVDDSLRFRGFVTDTKFNAVKVTIPGVQGTDWVSFDEISFNAIPEPSSFIAIGFFFAALLPRRSR